VRLQNLNTELRPEGSTVEEIVRLVVSLPVHVPNEGLEGTFAQGTRLRLSLFPQVPIDPLNYAYDGWDEAPDVFRRILDWALVEHQLLMKISVILRAPSEILSNSIEFVQIPVCILNSNFLPFLSIGRQADWTNCTPYRIKSKIRKLNMKL
jgi:hypothetical protein